MGLHCQRKLTASPCILWGFQRFNKVADEGSLLELRLESAEFVYNRYHYQGGDSAWHESDGYGSIIGWQGPKLVRSLPAWTRSRPVYVDHPLYVFWPTRQRAKGAYPFYNGHSTAYGYRYDSLQIRVPYRMLVVTFSIPLVVLAIIHRLQGRLRMARISRQLCVQCGYDLRSSNDRCPECGARTPKSENVQ